MKAKNKEKVAKIFALVVVLVMIFQVLLPLFSSSVLSDTQATVDTSDAQVQAPIATENTITTSETPAK